MVILSMCSIAGTRKNENGSQSSGFSLFEPLSAKEVRVVKKTLGYWVSYGGRKA